MNQDFALLNGNMSSLPGGCAFLGYKKEKYLIKFICIIKINRYYFQFEKSCLFL